MCFSIIAADIVISLLSQERWLNSLLALQKETGRIIWIRMIISPFSSYKEIGLCRWLDKICNWEEVLLIAFSEVKFPLNKTIYWLNNIISRATNLSHLIVMRFTDVCSFFVSVKSIIYQFSFIYIHTHKIILYISMCKQNYSNLDYFNNQTDWLWGLFYLFNDNNSIMEVFVTKLSIVGKRPVFGFPEYDQKAIQIPCYGSGLFLEVFERYLC